MHTPARSPAGSPASILSISFATALLAAAVPAQPPGQNVLFKLDGTVPGAAFGWAVASCDLDKDGRDDVVVSAYSAGTVYVYSGKDQRLLRTWRVSGMGRSVACGDVDNDGWPDVIAGAPGGAVVFSGRTAKLLGRTQGLRYGYHVRSGGDLNGDGHADVIVGSPLGSTSGRVVVFSGKDLTTRLHAWAGSAGGDVFGWSVASADVNGDKVPDVLVGAPRTGVRNGRFGYVRAYSGKTGAVLYTVRDTVQNTWFGQTVGVAGDVNKDGTPDWIASAPEIRKCDSSTHGIVRVLSGKDGKILRTLDPPCRLRTFADDVGDSLAGAGDVNGDGWPDVLAGGRHQTSRHGEVAFLFSGRDGSVLCRLFGDPSSMFGGASTDAVATGDVDGDGRADLIVGAYAFQGRGRVWVFSGRGPAKTVTFGTGCPKARPLTLGYTGVPSIGKTLTVNLSNGPAGPAPGVVLLGVSNAPPYPIDLSFLGMPGCKLWHNVNMDFGVTLSRGRASLSLPIPRDGALCHATFFNQGAAIDRTVGPLPVSASNAGRATIGW